MKKQSIIGIIIALLFGGGVTATLGTAFSDRVINYEVAGTSTSSPLSLGSNSTSTVYINGVGGQTQLDLNAVANVSTTETITVKTDFTVEDNCASSPTAVNWFTASTTSITADGDYNLAIKSNLLAECLRFTIYNASSTVTSTLYLQSTLR